MKVQNTQLDVMAPTTLRTKDQFGEVLRSLVAQHQDLIPEKYGYGEPLRLPFSMDAIPEIVRDTKWEYSVHFKRRKPHYEMHISLGTQWRPGSIHAWSDTRSIPTGTQLALLRSFSMSLIADLGFLHAFGETEERILPGQMSLSGGIGLPELRKYCPQLPWATVFGPPYVKMFSKDRLLSCPCFKTEELGPEHVYLQLSESADLVETDFEAYQTIRKQVKEHLGTDAFYDHVKGESGPYRTPEFSLPIKARGPLGYIDGNPVISVIGGRPVIQTKERSKTESNRTGTDSAGSAL